MNYYEWAQEYFDTADLLKNTIANIKSQSSKGCKLSKKELNLKLSKYRTYYNEAMQIGNHLIARAGGFK